MTDAKRRALETLEEVKRIYDSEGDILTASFWTDFMAVVDGQIDEIKRTLR